MFFFSKKEGGGRFFFGERDLSFSLGKKREKKCFKKNVSKEREETHKNLCTYYTLSLARDGTQRSAAPSLEGLFFFVSLPFPKRRAHSKILHRPSSDPTRAR